MHYVCKEVALAAIRSPECVRCGIFFCVVGVFSVVGELGVCLGCVFDMADVVGIFDVLVCSVCAAGFVRCVRCVCVSMCSGMSSSDNVRPRP